MIKSLNKCLFVHVPSCAGRTIRTVLGDKSLDSWRWPGEWESVQCDFDIKPHMDCRELSQCIPSNIFENIFKFGFVRNPWDRTVSIFERFKYDHKYNSFPNFVQNFLYTSQHNSYASQKKNQLDWFIKDGNVAVNFIGRFENLRDDLLHIYKVMKWDFPDKLPVITKTGPKRTKHYSEYYNESLKNIIEKRFCKDIEYFGYKFGE